MKRIKTITTLLLVCMLLSLTACSNIPETPSQAPSDTSSADSLEPDNTFYGYKIANEDGYGAATITFLTTYASSAGYQIDPFSNPDYDETKASAVQTAVAERTALVEEVLNVDIIEVPILSWQRNGSEQSEMLTAIRNDIVGGQYQYDVIMPCTRDAAILARNGDLLELKTEFDGFDPTNEWWSQRFNSDVTICDKLYFTVGDIGYVNKEATMFVAFNKKLMEDYHFCQDYGYDSIYEMVDDYAWTVDKMLAMSKSIYNDTNGNNRCDKGDLNGLAGQDGLVSWLLFGAGETATTNDANGEPKLSIYNQRAIKLIDMVQEYTADNKNGFLSANDYFSESNAPVADVTVPEFTAGRCLFFMDAVLNLELIRGMAEDFGIVPTPLLDESQTEYYSNISYWTSDALCIPKSYYSDKARLAMVADVLEAMGAVSKEKVVPVYYEQTLQNQISRDPESERMLDIIFDSRTVELASIYNWGKISGLLAELSLKAPGSFTSLYDSVKDSAQAEIDATIATFRD